MDAIIEKSAIKAAKHGDLKALSVLLKKDPALLLARDKDGSTPLHCAAWKGHSDVVKLLLELGASTEVPSQNGHYGTTALHAAAHGDQKEVVQILLAHGADIRAKNLHGRTPLQETAIHNARGAAKLLAAATKK